MLSCHIIWEFPQIHGMELRKYPMFVRLFGIGKGVIFMEVKGYGVAQVVFAELISDDILATLNLDDEGDLDVIIVNEKIRTDETFSGKVRDRLNELYSDITGLAERAGSDLADLITLCLITGYNWGHVSAENSSLTLDMLAGWRGERILSGVSDHLLEMKRGE